MLRRMTARQFHEWVAFAELEPFEPERLEQVITNIATILININRKRGTRPRTIEECRLKFGDDAETKVKPKQDWKAMKAIAEMMSSQFGGVVIQKPKQNKAMNAIAGMFDGVVVQKKAVKKPAKAVRKPPAKGKQSGHSKRRNR